MKYLELNISWRYLLFNFWNINKTNNFFKINYKIVHPETKHNHGHGLTLENHSEVSDKHAEYDSGSHYGGAEFGGHEKYHDINIHHGGDES